MQIAIGVLGVLVLGLLVWCVVLVRAGRQAQGVAHEMRRERDRLGDENTHLAGDLELAQRELELARSQAQESSGRVTELSVERAKLAERLDAAAKLIEEFKSSREQLKEDFAALGGKTLQANQEALGRFLTERLKEVDEKSSAEFRHRKESIDSLVKPISETLAKTKEQITQLDERVKASSDSNESLVKTTAKLAQALAKPHIRGAYGEIQLKRVAELSGMRSYCDFGEQSSQADSEGNQQRPDMVVKMPNNRVVIVDAKANIYAYHEALNAESPEEREKHLVRFGKHIKDQAVKLSSKQYWKNFEQTPDFVVMFVPGDNFVDEALARNPDLIEFTAERNVILASPSTLIGLLRAVALGWQEHRLSENAKELRALGEELLQRSEGVFKHTINLGRTLNQSVGHFNGMVGSLNSRLLPTLRKFEENKEVQQSNSLEAPSEIERQARELPEDSFKSVDAGAQES